MGKRAHRPSTTFCIWSTPTEMVLSAVFLPVSGAKTDCSLWYASLDANVMVTVGCRCALLVLFWVFLSCDRVRTGVESQVRVAKRPARGSPKGCNISRGMPSVVRIACEALTTVAVSNEARRGTSAECMQEARRTRQRYATRSGNVSNLPSEGWSRFLTHAQLEAVVRHRTHAHVQVMFTYT